MRNQVVISVQKVDLNQLVNYNFRLKTQSMCFFMYDCEPGKFYLLFSLKLKSVIFCLTFIFSLNHSPSKVIKNVFYFIEKALSVLKISKCLYFFSFLSTLSKFKRTNKNGIIYNVINWLA